MGLRLATHGQPVAPGQVAIDGPNLLRDVGEGFAEKLEPLLLDFLEFVLGSLGAFARVFEFLVRGLEPVLDHFQPLDRAHIRRHVV